MGNCKYCGKPAGLLRRSHAECEERQKRRLRVAEGGRQRIAAAITRAIKGTDDFDLLEKAIADIEESSNVPSTETRALLAKGWEDAVEHFLDDGLLDASEEARLAAFRRKFSLSQDELDKNGALTRTAKAGVLRDVCNGLVPQRMSFDQAIPINLQKDEKIVWAFAGSKYLEDKTRRQYVGGSQAVSIRVMKGVYYRVGAFKGHAVEHTERVHIDTGLVAATNKNLYFVGPKKSVRLPYAKIVSFEPFSDGIGVMRDAASAKAQIFVTGDGWFAYNLITNLARI